MKISRFLCKGIIGWGIIQGATIKMLKTEPFEKIEQVQREISLKKCKLLPPTAPTKIILVGLNYKDHARELRMQVPREPIIFLKPPTSIIGPKDEIYYPKNIRRVDYEAELAVVIGKKAKYIKESDVNKYVFGYTCLNDITARDLQKRDKQWTRAKSFDTFCPIGPWIETDLDPSNVTIKLYLNGKLRQCSSTSNLIFSVKYLVSFISHVMTLFPGDVIATGTPSGVGSMKKGDLVEIEIEKIGRLENYVI